MRPRRPRRLMVLAALGAALLLPSACEGEGQSPEGDPPEGTAEEEPTADDDADATEATPGDAGEPEQGEDTVTIGLLNPTTGPFTSIGEDVNAGFRLLVEDRGGSLAGYDIEIVAEDEANDTEAATEGAERLVEEAGADLIVGLVNSGVAYGISTYIEQAGIPLIITVAGADDLTQRDAVENIFRVSYTGSSDSMPAGTYACEELGHETAAVIGLDYAFGWEGVGGFARAFEDAGCEVVQETYVPLDTADWSPFVEELDRSVDLVWALAAGPDSMRLLQAYRDLELDMPLMTHGSAVGDEVLAQQGPAAQGVVSTLHYSRQIDSDANERFVDLFESAYERVASRYAEAGWTSGLVLEQALGEFDEGEEVDDQTLAAAIGQVSVQAPRGPVAFDEYGQAVQNIYVREVREVDEAYRNVVVDTIPEVSQFWTYEPEEYLSWPPYSELVGTWAE